ncbi:helix-turn-helix transcriptional regulator [Cohnella fermenti]|uniref:helix-turn-helix transcriptional regulator n=1 Tax=Cohnella fermenti TaxID=2565925 RepID=UPI001E2ADE36|nr:helix-turn-helix domain-containing protein [Cohnella fermenti]
MLHIDPDARSREATERMIDWTNSGYALEARAASPADARTLFDKQPFSLVLINLKHSHAEGLRLCELIRERSRVPILLIGGSHDFYLARQALVYQVSDYLPEPVQPAELLGSLSMIKRELDARAGAESPFAAALARRRSRQSSIIDHVKQYVQEELHQSITLKKISDSLHFNCAYLGQKFKSEENMSFNEYLLQQRMEKAKLLLEQTDLKIYEIAGEVGYTELDWFYKKFKEYTGISANEYRKQLIVTA